MSRTPTPRTPSPEPGINRKPSEALQSPRLAGGFRGLQKSPSLDKMTPPPSTQAPPANSRGSHSKHVDDVRKSLASPPATIRTAPPITSAGLYGEVPSPEYVQQMDEPQLRQLIADLLASLGEARVAAAHSKLQHNLLAMEKEEAAQRAEVEHEATRREVEALQENSPLQRQGFSPESPKTSMQHSLQLALAHCRELQGENAMLERRLRASKKLIAELDGENVELKDRNHLLRQRIKVNRDHLNEMQSSGAISIYGSPVTDYATPPMRPTPRTPATGRASRDLDTLLMAGQMLNGEATSVPSTPTPAKPRVFHTQHVRGAHSLSSLPTTPHRPPTLREDHLQPIQQSPRADRPDISYSSSQAFREDSRNDRDERDSTISVSDREDDPDQRDAAMSSPASQRATSMLRRSLGSSQTSSVPSGANTSKQIQGKLKGQVRKPEAAQGDQSLKRSMGDDGSPPRSNKKVRMTPGRDKVGLGIRDWPR